ncbi:TlpA family protein disulfide reductase [Tamlana sp. I1]|uniref:TlpA family protein disulfide reductase n=1 Tax=Tamlana sp. I1 TaxID=2762061 RepID=UPI00188F6AF8|nr:TlpA disulfide reductase family protein [Tamlana sp. I1]
MRKLLLLTLAISVFACKNEQKPNYAIISGTITNKLPGELTINTYDRTFTEKIETSSDGTFKDTLDLEHESYVFFDGKNPIFLYVEPGYNLNINYDANDFENTLIITGEGAPENNYLVQKLKKGQQLLGDNQTLYTLNEDDYKNKQRAVVDSLKNLLNNTKGISKTFKTKEEKELNYTYLAALNIYEKAHQYFSKNNDFKVSDDFLNELEGFDYSDEKAYETSRSYKSIVTSHYKEQIEALIKNDSLSQEEAFFTTIREIPNESIKNSILFDYAKQSIAHSKDIEAFYKTYNEISTNEKNNTLITEQYNKLTAVTKGKPSPKFVNYENYKGGTTSLDDLKGKYVYIDVWATWCGPCKREIPFLKELEKKYHDKNIEFVSLSIDKVSDREKWKKMIETEDLKGVQLLADNDWKSSFVQEYQIQGIPRFILIDTDGNIVDPNAPRPSDPKLVDLFTALSI